MEAQLDAPNICTKIRNQLKKGESNYISLGKYILTKFLGEGSFGEVYKGVDQTQEREVAVKIVDLEFMDKKACNKEVRQIQRRLLRTEEEMMKKCKCANVIKCYDIISNSRYKIFVLEYCNGGSLNEYIQKQNSIPEEDLKPENILIHNGVFKIADFGFSKQVKENEVKVGTLLGTKCTMAPEVIRREPYGVKVNIEDIEADIWSIGIIFYIMICNSAPYDVRHELAISQAISRDFAFHTIDGKFRSAEVNDFLRNVLTDAERRMSSKQLLEHPMFVREQKKLVSKFIPLDISLLQRMREKVGDNKDQIKTEEEHDKNKLDESQNGLGKVEDDKMELKPFKQYKPLAIVVNKDDELFQRLSEIHLECLKAEFILTQIIEPIENGQLLDLNYRENIEILFLFAHRCFFNVSCSRHKANGFNSGNNLYLESHYRQTEELYKLAKQKYDYYSKQLTKIENGTGERIKDATSKYFKSKTFKKKSLYLNEGCEKEFMNEDDESYYYNKQMQIDFTNEHYISAIVNEIEENGTTMKAKFVSYKRINEIKLEDVSLKNFDMVVWEILEDEL